MPARWMMLASIGSALTAFVLARSLATWSIIFSDVGDGLPWGICLLIILQAMLLNVIPAPANHVACVTLTAALLGALPGSSLRPSLDVINSHELPAAAPAAAPRLALPEQITSVIVNIGSNDDPPRPPKGDPSVAVIAVEPIPDAAARIKPHPRLFVIRAAVAPGPAHFAVLHTRNGGGVSSSLARPSSRNAQKPWSKNTQGDVYVPVLPLRALLDAIPPHVNITHLVTDMQGFDYAALSDAGRAIRRVPDIVSEVYVGTSTYAGVANDLNRDWKPWAQRMGYSVERQGSGFVDDGGRSAKEVNMRFVRIGSHRH